MHLAAPISHVAMSPLPEVTAEYCPFRICSGFAIKITPKIFSTHVLHLFQIVLLNGTHFFTFAYIYVIVRKIMFSVSHPTYVVLILFLDWQARITQQWNQNCKQTTYVHVQCAVCFQLMIKHSGFQFALGKYLYKHSLNPYIFTLSAGRGVAVWHRKQHKGT